MMRSLEREYRNVSETHIMPAIDSHAQSFQVHPLALFQMALTVLVLAISLLEACLLVTNDIGKGPK
jgi:hypothetical protein